MRNTAQMHAGGNFRPGYAVESGKVNALFPELYGKHAASDVYADKMRNDLVRNGHGGSDDAAGACMTVRHDTDDGSGSGWLIQKTQYLGGRSAVAGVSEKTGGIIGSLYFDQCLYLTWSDAMKKSRDKPGTEAESAGFEPAWTSLP